MKETPTARPLVSIIIATLNAGPVLQDCFRAIAALQMDSLEVVVVDGGSSDNTLAIVGEQKYFSPVLISGRDTGIYDAYNKGVVSAGGQWLYFLGADDRLLPDFAQMVLQLTDDNTIYYANPEPYYTGADPGFILLGGAFSKYRLAKFPMNHQSILYPAKVFQKYQYDQRYRIFADYALTMQAWGDPLFKQRYVPLTIVQYHMNGFSSSLNDPVFKAEKNRLIRERLGWPVYLRYHFKRWKKRLMGESGKE